LLTAFNLTTAVTIMATTQKEVALIVGASRGIGRQIAIDLAREGYAGMCSTQTWLNYS
jgi:plasmid maintenance system antidote protein VapI